MKKTFLGHKKHFPLSESKIFNLSHPFISDDVILRLNSSQMCCTLQIWAMEFEYVSYKRQSLVALLEMEDWAFFGLNDTMVKSLNILVIVFNCLL